MTDTALTDREQAMIVFERQWWKQPGAKEQAIRDTFGLSPTRYYQQMLTAIARPEAVAFDPVTVNRLRRLLGRRRVA